MSYISRFVILRFLFIYRLIIKKKMGNDIYRNLTKLAH